MDANEWTSEKFSDKESHAQNIRHQSTRSHLSEVESHIRKRSKNFKCVAKK